MTSFNSLPPEVVDMIFAMLVVDMAVDEIAINKAIFFPRNSTGYLLNVISNPESSFKHPQNAAPHLHRLRLINRACSQHIMRLMERWHPRTVYYFKGFDSASMSSWTRWAHENKSLPTSLFENMRYWAIERSPSSWPNPAQQHHGYPLAIEMGPSLPQQMTTSPTQICIMSETRRHVHNGNPFLMVNDNVRSPQVVAVNVDFRARHDQGSRYDRDFFALWSIGKYQMSQQEFFSGSSEALRKIQKWGQNDGAAMSSQLLLLVAHYVEKSGGSGPSRL